jgi:glycosyltransferase involved in cell wall biosynthesis
VIRILQLIPTLDPAGSEKQQTLLAQGLPRDQFEVEVCCLTRGGPYQADLARAGIPVTVIGKPLKIDPGAMWKLVRLLRRRRPDVLHTWLAACNAYGRVAARLAGVPVVVATERCADVWKGAYWFSIDRWLARRTDRIVVNSRGVARFYQRHGIAPERMTLICNGVEPHRSNGVDRDAIRRGLGLSPEHYVIGFAGRLAPQKRVADLIWAADILKVIRPNVQLLIVGDGPSRARLERFAHDCHITDRVHFLGHRDDVAELLSAMDVFWLGSGYEGMPNAVMEAMAAGLPVVATNIPGTNELVVDGQTGFLVPVGDRAAFAQRTFTLMEDPDRARRLGDAGRRRVAERFTVQHMVDQHVHLYRELVEHHGRTCSD